MQIIKDIVRFRQADESYIDSWYALLSEHIIECSSQNSSYCYSQSEKLYSRLKQHISEYTIATIDNRILGFFYFHPYHDNMIIEDFYVMKEYCGIGVGKAILLHCVSLTEKDIFIRIESTDKIRGNYFAHHDFIPVAQENSVIIHRFHTKWNK